MALGQFVRLTPLKHPLEKFKKNSRVISELILVATVFKTFCDSFIQGLGISSGALLALCVTLPIAYVLSNALFWTITRCAMPDIDIRDLGAAMIW